MIPGDTSIRDLRVLITGVAGTIGQALLERVLGMHPRAVRGIDIDGAALARVAARHGDAPELVLARTDIRDARELTRAVAGADVVFHAAAMKDVGECERDPDGAVESNVRGTRNVVQAVRDAAVPRLVFLSTDKAVHPTSVMGAAKLLGERLVARAQLDAPPGCRYCIVRFVNVLGSSASVIPVFHEQIVRGGPVTLTDPRMTRFVMSLTDAVSLILRALASTAGGDIFVPRMQAVRIADIAGALIEDARESGRGPIAIHTIGARAAEKLDEEIMTAEEARHVIECARHYIIPAPGTPPQQYDGYLRVGSMPVPHSGMVATMTGDALRYFLMRHELLRPAATAPSSPFASPSLARA